MNDLSHWDIADEFTGAQVVILRHGQDPNVLMEENSAGSLMLQPMFAPTYDRMKRSYDKAREYFLRALNPPEFFDGVAPIDMLQSVDMTRELSATDLSDGRRCNFYVWLCDENLSGFDAQRFSIKETARWLDVIGQPSMYSFNGMLTPPATKAVLPKEIDPSDLPDELDCANLAYRAVKNGYGDQSKTLKNRTVEYLENTYPNLKPEAVQRIATVANPDRSRGRKRGSLK